jgi:glutathione S-transferase
LESWFDEQLGPHIRLLVFHELSQDRERFDALAVRGAPGPLARLTRPAGAYGRAFVAMRFGVRSAEAADIARGKVLAALDRLEAELGSGEYLVGDRFTVADLTAAALFYPLALPPAGPHEIDGMPDAFERFRAPLTERRGCRWVGEMFRRHRRPSSRLAAR